jgi:hypothetical protein
MQPLLIPASVASSWDAGPSIDLMHADAVCSTCSLVHGGRHVQQVCAGVCRCVQVCAGVCRCVQVCMWPALTFAQLARDPVRGSIWWDDRHVRQRLAIMQAPRVGIAAGGSGGYVKAVCKLSGPARERKGHLCARHVACCAASLGNGPISAASLCSIT